MMPTNRIKTNSKAKKVDRKAGSASKERVKLRTNKLTESARSRQARNK